VPFDWQAHDTHFVVAHLHYVLIGGLMFPLFAGLYYWLPLASGRMPNESIGRMAFWLVIIGFHLTFVPMHLTGLLGMPRRVYTYSPALGVEWINLLSTAASFVLAVGIVAILVDAGLCFLHGRRARANPWRAASLEWAVPVPVPAYNFASVPSVDDAYPLWRDSGLPERVNRTDGLLGDPARGRRELLGTGIVSARPEQVVFLSGASWLPLACAGVITVLLACFIAGWYLAAAVCLLPLLALFCGWAWTTGWRGGPASVDAGNGLVLPSQYACRNAPGWWAIVVTMLIVGSLFASLVFAYFYLWLGSDAWPPAGMGDAAPGAMHYAALALLAIAWVAGAAASAALRAGLRRRRRAAVPAIVAAVAVVAFSAIHLGLLSGSPGAPQAHAYASVVWTLAGFCALHLVVAAVLCLHVAARLGQRLVDATRPLEWRVAHAFLRYAIVQAAIGWAVVHLFPVLQ
jgi:cytochrome c oxidase subunit I+III